MSVEVLFANSEYTPTQETIGIFVRAINEALARCPEMFSHVIRPVVLQDPAEIAAITALVQRNFHEHPHYKIPETQHDTALNARVVAKYIEANSYENLLASMSEVNAFPFVLEQNGDVLGFLLCKVAKDGSLKVHRLHSSLRASEKGVLGAGKALLNMAAIMARQLGISRLSATASYPAKEYFEHLGWVGELEKNTFPFGENETVDLTQFRCSIDITNEFEGF